MPTEASLRHKLNKKIKISTGKSKIFKTQHAIDDDKSHKVNRKLNISTGRSTNFRTQHAIDDDKSHKVNKKLKISTGRSKNFRPQHAINDDKSGKKENGGKKLNLSGKDKRVHRGREGSGAEVYERGMHEPMNSDKKRKRIYAAKEVKFDFVKQKDGGKSRSMWVSSKKKDAASELGDVEESAQVSNTKRRGKGMKVKKMDSGQRSSLNMQSKNKSDSKRNLDASLKRFQDKFPSMRTKITDKKGFDDDSEVLDDKPRKKKRVIRIDPYDISNKRLDDGLVIDETAKEKKKDLEKKDEMSKNAQFRAIQPSPSILSFVEDNLLGRRRLMELRRAGYNTELSAPLDNIPFSTSPERERIEENFFRNKLTFFAAAKVSSSFPPPDLPEIAFAGRSNVGKSSLLNALTRQWGVVRTSDKPGLTQTINFFNLGPKLCLVDLPGYGFAYAKEEVKDAWEELVMEYVSTRVGLKRVCLLIDTKWGMKPRDHELINLMERSHTKYQIVLTKTDMVFPIDVARHAMQIEESLKANKSIVQPVMMVSSKTGAGIRSLRTVFSKIARFAKV